MKTSIALSRVFLAIRATRAANYLDFIHGRSLAQNILLQVGDVNEIPYALSPRAVPNREQTINSSCITQNFPPPALLYKYPVAESSMTYTYHFFTSWRLKASADEVYDIIGQPLEYPRWWPSVYLDCRETARGAA